MTAKKCDCARYGAMLGSYDVLVVGGGITGAAAAYGAASAGLRVGLLEPTGVLGREIARARCQYAHWEEASGTEADGDSPSMQAFLQQLQRRGGLFHGGIMDPHAAALAFDDMLASCGADVIFHAWPARLLSAGDCELRGILAATKGGYRTVEAGIVIDASAQGKLSRAYFRPVANADAVSVLNLLAYDSSRGEEAASETVGEPSPWSLTATLDHPVLGAIEAAARPTHWKGEYRVSLTARARLGRSQWLPHLGELWLRLQRELEPLGTAVLTYIGADVRFTPEEQLHTGSDDGEALGYLALGGGERRAVRPGHLHDPDTMRGLILAGFWAGEPLFDPLQEERAFDHAFRLGDAAAACALRSAGRGGLA